MAILQMRALPLPTGSRPAGSSVRWCTDSEAINLIVSAKKERLNPLFVDFRRSLVLCPERKNPSKPCRLESGPCSSRAGTRMGVSESIRVVSGRHRRIRAGQNRRSRFRRGDAIQTALETRGIVFTNGDKPGFYFGQRQGHHSRPSTPGYSLFTEGALTRAVRACASLLRAEGYGRR